MARLKTSGLLVIISTLVIIFIVFGYLAIKKKEKATISNAIEAIPIDASLIVEIPDLSNFSKNINKDSSVVFSFFQIKNLNYFTNTVDSFLVYSNTFKEIIKKEKIIVSFHNFASKELVPLIAFKIPDTKKQNELLTDILAYNKTTDTVAREYSNTKIYNIGKDTNKLYFSFNKNIFIISSSELLIENSIRQKNSNNPINLDVSFKETYKNVSKNKIHIFFNYENFAETSKILFSNSFYRKAQILKDFAHWTAFDLSYKQNSVTLSGNTYFVSSSKMYLLMFENNKPKKLVIDKYLPYKTSEFYSISIDDFSTFFSKYENYLSSKNLAGPHSKKIEDFSSLYKINIKSDITPYIGNSATIANVRFNNQLDNFSEFLIYELNDKTKFQNVLNNVISENLTGNQTISDLETIYEIDNITNIKIYEFPSTEFNNLLFENALPMSVEFNYYMFVDNYIFWSNKTENLEKLFYDYYTHKTLLDNEDYKDYKKNIPEKSNIIFYTNNNFNASKQTELLGSNFKKIYEQNLNFFNKFQFVTLQFSFDKKSTFQTYLNLYFNKNLKNKGITVWEKELKSNVSKKPILFLNHYSFEKEILIADDSNNIYLIDKDGQTLWAKHLKEKFVDNFNIVDLYNNKKYQILLTTSNNIITFDRNGKVLMEKSTELPAQTTLGISVIDYENNNDYRIFVPCTDNKVYLYDKNIKKVDGWKIPSTNSTITSKVHYFNYQSKDYIVFSDKTNTFILNRKGEKRIDVKQNIPSPNYAYFYFQEQTNISKASFVTSDASGKVTFIDLDGNVYFKNLITLSSNHTFIAKDLNNDKNLDFIFTDDNTIFVYNSDGSKIFSHTFSDAIQGEPSVYYFSDNNIQIGITTKNNKQIYIFDLDGKIRNNFPLSGSSDFTIGKLSSENKYNILVGQNNFLYNYLLF